MKNGAALILFSLSLLGQPSLVVAADKPEVFVPLGNANPVWSIGYLEDGKTMWTGSRDSLRFWDIVQRKEMRSFVFENEHIAVSPDGKSAVMIDPGSETVTIVGLASPRRVTLPRGWYSSLAISPDGRFVFVAGSSGEISRVDIQTGKEMGAFKGHAKGIAVRSVAVSPDGGALLSVGDDMTVRLWEVSTGRILHVFNVPQDPYAWGANAGIGFSHDGKIAFLGNGSQVVEWNIASGEVMRTYALNKEPVRAIAVTADMLHAFSGSPYEKIKMWSIPEGTLEKEIGDTGNAGFLSLTPDGRYLMTSDGGNGIVQWELATGKRVQTYGGQVLEASSIATLSDGSLVRSTGGARNPTVAEWQLASGRRVRTYGGFPHAFLEILPGGSYVKGGGQDMLMHVWDIQTGKEVFQWNVEDFINMSTRIRVSPDGRYLVTGDSSGRILLGDLSTRKWIAASDGLDEMADVDVAFTPDGTQILSCTVDSQKTPRPIAVLDAISRKLVRNLEAPSDEAIRRIAISRDGKLVVGSSLTSFTTWEFLTGRKIKSFPIQKPVASGFRDDIFLTPDARYVLRGGGSAGVWEIATGKEVTPSSISLRNLSALLPDSTHALLLGRGITVVDFLTGKERATMYSFLDDEWVVLTPEGYFDCSENGMQYLSARVGGKVLGIDEYAVRYRKPEYVRISLEGKPVPTN